MRRTLRLCLIGVVELVAVLAALTAILASAAAWTLSRGPVSLDFLREDVQAALVELFAGDLVALGGIEAAWSSSEDGFVLALTDVAVAKAGGEVIAASRRLEAGLRPGSLLRGRISFSRLSAVGGSATVRREADGDWTFTLGSPDAVSSRSVTLKPRDEPIDFAAILAALPPVVGRLEAVSVTDATVHVIDERHGFNVTLHGADVSAERKDAAVSVKAAGRLARSEAGVASFELRTSEGFGEAFAEARFVGAPLAALAPSSGPLKGLKGFKSVFDARASLAWSEGRGLTAAEIEADVAPGSARIAGRSVPVRTFDLLGVYEPTTQSIVIDRLDVDVGDTKGRIAGRIDALGLKALIDPRHDAPFDLSVEDLSLDLAPLFAAPLQASRIDVKGRLRLADRAMSFDRLDADIRGLKARLTGEAALVKTAAGAVLPEIRLSGPIGGEASPRDVIELWPVDLAEGARSWLDAAIIGGRLFDAHLDLDLNAEALVRQRLDDDRLTLSFSFEDAAVRVVSTMSPITAASGSGVLRGNSFSLTMTEGRLRESPVRDGFVEIPRLNPRGALARFGMTAQGSVRDVVMFIDEPPFGLASEAGFDPERLSGEGELRIELMRPMLKDVPVEDLKFTLSGRYENVAGPGPFEGFDFRNARVDLEGDELGLRANVEADIGPIPARFVWTERFRDGGATRTRYDLTARIDSAVLDALGAPARRFFAGGAEVRAVFAGVGLKIAEAAIDADLTDAALSAPGTLWTKPIGAPAKATLNVAGTDDGGFAISDVAVEAAGFTLRGAARLGSDGRLLNLAADQVALSDSFDFGVAVDRTAAGGFDARIKGPLIDARGALGQLARSGSEGALGAPLTIDIEAERALIGPEAALDAFSMRIEHDGVKARALQLSAQGPSGPVSASLTTDTASGARRFDLAAADAGLLLEALFDAAHVRGGSLTIEADLPALDAPADAATRARLKAQDFTLVGAPAMARILTLGSLQGLAETLAGEGISFERLSGELVLSEGLARFDNMRAAGPSIGVTLGGVVDLKARSVDLEGVLVPAYTFNSVLGSLPVIGDILVSRKGEGVFALTYTLDGPFSAMRVFVNPLSALAPGVLRRIFEGSSTAQGDALLTSQPPASPPAAFEDVIIDADPAAQPDEPQP